VRSGARAVFPPDLPVSLVVFLFASTGCGARTSIFPGGGVPEADASTDVSIPADALVVDGSLCPIHPGTKDCCAVTVTPGSSASITLPIVAPGLGLQDFTGCTVDVVSPDGDAVLVTVSGDVGANGCAASVDLFAADAGYPDSGTPTDTNNDWNVPAGGEISISALTSGSTTYHLGADGNWNSPQGQTNVVTLTISAELVTK
jgi:hypothetical protein